MVVRAKAGRHADKLKFGTDYSRGEL